MPAFSVKKEEHDPGNNYTLSSMSSYIVHRIIGQNEDAFVVGGIRGYQQNAVEHWNNHYYFFFLMLFLNEAILFVNINLYTEIYILNYLLTIVVIE